MPTTLPSNELVARNDSRPGISMSNDGVWSSSVKPPIWKRENPAGCSVSQSASTAAIFIGWASVTATPNSLPTPSWTIATGSPTTIASFAAARKTSTLRRRRRCQQDTPSTRNVAGHQPGQDGVRPCEEHEPLEEDLDDVGRLRAAGLLVDLVADRVLHPGVRRQDEVGREPGPDPDEVDRREVNLRGQPVPAEDPQADERRLEHERADPLDREGRAEDVSHVGRERGPVHAELELHDEACRDPDREVDDEQRPEEPRQAEPSLVAGAVPERLHHREQRCQPQRQGDEDEVEQRRQRELPARKLESGVGNRCHVAGTARAPAPGPIAITSSSRPLYAIDRLVTNVDPGVARRSRGGYDGGEPRASSRGGDPAARRRASVASTALRRPLSDRWPPGARARPAPRGRDLARRRRPRHRAGYGRPTPARRNDFDPSTDRFDAVADVRQAGAGQTRLGCRSRRPCRGR